MIAVRKRTWLPAKLLLFVMVTAAQSGALAHAFKHDAATPQNPTCAICLTVSQLDSSCIDALAVTEPAIVHASPVAPKFAIPGSMHLPFARQRGPPVPA